ncbi:MAG: NTP transferase domain-containing protein [Bacteroidaceae bacterium]|nr:NTP transferase domain-containing protein [Bacteroidaceae bacterium]
MKAMIFAAGLGTRLKPLTDTMPKALVPVGGRPLLEILLEKLEREGFDDIVINVHHFADKIEAWMDSKAGVEIRKKGIKISFSDERKELLETGGGIRHARPLLGDCGRVLIHNVDILSNVRLRNFFEAGEHTAATLLVSERETQRYLLFDDNMRLVGWTNRKTGEVKSPYPGLNPEDYRSLAFAGIHQMSASLFPLMDQWPEKFSIIDFYLSVCATQPIYGYVQPDLQLMDVGKLDTLPEADRFLETVLTD